MMQTSATPLLSHRNLLILAAMPEEEAAILDLLHPHAGQTRELGNNLKIQVREFTCSGIRLQLARTGVGPVNAAVTLALIAETHRPDAVILLGVGGALHPELCVGDRVIPEWILQHDSLSSLQGGNLRMRPGHFLLAEAEASEHDPLFATDPALSAVLAGALPRSGGHRTFQGTLLSGSEFVGRPERKRELALVHRESRLVDMEAAGVAQIAHRLKIPFAVSKTVADRLEPDQTISADFSAFLKTASENAALALRNLLPIS